MFGRFLLATTVLTATPSAQAAWDIGVGPEAYQWIEYPTDTSGNPKEFGMRLGLFVNWTQEGDQGLLAAWRAKVYAGTVNYDTFDIDTGKPTSTTTDYLGVASEPQLFYRYNLGAYKLDQLAGIGLDNWRRRIGGNQIEDYSVLYLRAGLRLARSRREAGFHGELGLKYPVSIGEDAHFESLGYTSNPPLSPKPALSGYAEVGYRINSTYDLLGYYDSWRFNRSDDVAVTNTAGATKPFYQPKSNMDALGIKLLVSF